MANHRSSQHRSVHELFAMDSTALVGLVESLQNDMLNCYLRTDAMIEVLKEKIDAILEDDYHLEGLVRGVQAVLNEIDACFVVEADAVKLLLHRAGTKRYKVLCGILVDEDLDSPDTTPIPSEQCSIVDGKSLAADMVSGVPL